MEGWRAIELANETFGFGGWTSCVKELTVDFVRAGPHRGLHVLPDAAG